MYVEVSIGMCCVEYGAVCALYIPVGLLECAGSLGYLDVYGCLVHCVCT